MKELPCNCPCSAIDAKTGLSQDIKKTFRTENKCCQRFGGTILSIADRKKGCSEVLGVWHNFARLDANWLLGQNLLELSFGWAKKENCLHFVSSYVRRSVKKLLR